jgi:hypothetical protein
MNLKVQCVKIQMESIITSFAKRIYTHGNHVGFVLKYKQLQPICKKWSKNRHPDMNRVQEMYEYHNNGGYIPKLIHLAELKDEGLICYDGNHRREYLQMIEDDEVECVVDIIFNATNDDVIESFKAINKAVDVPEIYLEDSMNIKDDVLELVKKYETTFKPFVSRSSKCRTPNFNRDVFTENITKIYRFMNGSKTIKEIEELLNILNLEYSKIKYVSLIQNTRNLLLTNVRSTICGYFSKEKFHRNMWKRLHIKRDLEFFNYPHKFLKCL